MGNFREGLYFSRTKTDISTAPLLTPINYPSPQAPCGQVRDSLARAGEQRSAE